MRSLYTQIGPNIAIQQGVIINGCIADKCKENVSGIIITPRCDIGNGGKVSTIHYLPVIKIEDWIKSYVLPEALVAEKNQLTKILEEQKHSSKILDVIKEPAVERLKLKNRTLQDRLKNYIQARDNIKYGKEIIKHIDNELTNLVANKHNRYYIIEDWHDTSPINHYVIILREIKRMELEFATTYTKGFQSKLINEEVAKANDVAVVPYSFDYQTLCEIGSPYIEYILQQFSHNFCRIGVEELERNATKKLYNIEKIINQ